MLKHEVDVKSTLEKHVLGARGATLVKHWPLKTRDRRFEIPEAAKHDNVMRNMRCKGSVFCGPKKGGKTAPACTMAFEQSVELIRRSVELSDLVAGEVAPGFWITNIPDNLPRQHDRHHPIILDDPNTKFLSETMLLSFLDLTAAGASMWGRNNNVVFPAGVWRVLVTNRKMTTLTAKFGQEFQEAISEKATVLDFYDHASSMRKSTYYKDVKGKPVPCLLSPAGEKAYMKHLGLDMADDAPLPAEGPTSPDASLVRASPDKASLQARVSAMKAREISVLNELTPSTKRRIEDMLAAQDGSGVSMANSPVGAVQGGGRASGSADGSRAKEARTWADIDMDDL